MIKSAYRGILTLLLVSGVAMAMLLGFGVRATQKAQEAQVSPIECRYTQLIMTAKAPEMP
ncbi:MAG: hypothetical protein VB099_16560 [Candidatus Limiplasma sp.]|nr:hypothetical protein [Candidatus Limiplasma sp.]